MMKETYEQRRDKDRLARDKMAWTYGGFLGGTMIGTNLAVLIWGTGYGHPWYAGLLALCAVGGSIAGRFGPSTIARVYEWRFRRAAREAPKKSPPPNVRSLSSPGGIGGA